MKMREAIRNHPLIVPTVFTISAALLSIFIGSSGLLFSGIIFDGADIIYSIRLPRTVLTALSGASLAVSGLMFQTLFRNPLATPYTLGVSSGAGLGAALSVLLPISPFLPEFLTTTAMAFVGALFSVVIILLLLRSVGSSDSTVLLLCGVAVSFTFSSLIMLVRYFAGPEGSFRIMHWLMGSLDTYGYRDAFTVLPFFLLIVITALNISSELDMFGVDDDSARVRGVDTAHVQTIVFVLVSVTVAGVVSVIGPVGFVGMMVPHICRLFTGWSHRVRIPVTLMSGAGLLLSCDVVARLVIMPAELPVGIITAVLGGPFFLWLLFRQRERG